jgi:hypothetical protein
MASSMLFEHLEAKPPRDLRLRIKRYAVRHVAIKL